MMEYSFKIVSSLEKLFFEKVENIKEFNSGSMLKNEVFSFQIACWIKDDSARRIPCKIKIISDLKPYITVFRIGYVPNMLSTYNTDTDDYYLSKHPGLFPDPLYRIKNGNIDLESGQMRAFWISVRPTEDVYGKYPIKIIIEDNEQRFSEELYFELRIINAQLPELPIINTSWFHGDCLAALHHVDINSDAYYAILEKYLKVYVQFGHNMILTPIFTPPLDTEIGGERPTNQLVQVTADGDNYFFDFSLLEKWIHLCQHYGVKYFEIAHLFTQWGAKHAPKIMATVKGEYKRIFGWETDAQSKEYIHFLDVFLAELKRFLKEEKIWDCCYFHISDEPKEDRDQNSYYAAKQILVKHIDQSKMIDALADFCFYEKGMVTTPIVATNHIETFIDRGVENLWAYYCCVQDTDVANRFIAMPSYRNRILGYQLYKYHIKGFLQWGFNFWFAGWSRYVINPFLDTCAGGDYPSGDPFVVYPMDTGGEVICSLRLHVFRETLQDLRALTLLESLTDREKVLSLLDEIQGFKVYPRNSEYILNIRAQINSEIERRIN